MRLFGFFAIVRVLSVRAATDVHQVPIMGGVGAPDSAVVGEIGIGIHFTTSYAVAVARYQNGTTQDIATISADAEYINVMSRWMDSYPDLQHMDKR
jgi:ATP-dependent protease HslVU (ClpYQ) peptidase subunit